MISLFKRNQVYWCRFNYAGERCRVSLRTNDYSVAQHVALKIVDRVFSGLEPWPEMVDRVPAGTTKQQSIVQAFEKYLELASGSKAHHTLRTEKSVFKSFVLEYMAGKSPSATDLEQFKAQRLKEVSSSQVAKLVRTIKAVWSGMVSLGLIESNPFEKVKCPKIVKQEIRFLSRERREALLQASESIGRDIHLIVALGSLAGLRSAEIANARWSWIDLERKTLTVSNSDCWQTKSKRSRTIPLCDRLLAILSRYYNPQTSQTGFIVFPAKQQPAKEGQARYDCRKSLAKSCRIAGIEPVGLHVLRKSFASLLVQSGVDLLRVSRWLGHSSTMVTQQHYATLQCGFDDRINCTAEQSA